MTKKVETKKVIMKKLAKQIDEAKKIVSHWHADLTDLKRGAWPGEDDPGVRKTPDHV